eukprot:COSAG04_NODE_1106_length_8232_cov_4.848641_7_plen_116_part_00
MPAVGMFLWINRQPLRIGRLTGVRLPSTFSATTFILICRARETAGRSIIAIQIDRVIYLSTDHFEVVVVTLLFPPTWLSFLFPTASKPVHISPQISTDDFLRLRLRHCDALRSLW